MENEEQILTYKMNFPVVRQALLGLLQSGFMISAEEVKNAIVDFNLTRTDDVQDNKAYTLKGININFDGKDE